MEYQDIILKKEGHIATLIMNRPDKMNAVSPQMRLEIPEALYEVDRDENIRVLILTGAGDRAFCSGADVGSQADRIAGKVKPTRRQITERLAWFVALFREIRVPTIAAVNGIAAGVGLSYALICDLRIASDKARFGCLWVKRGLIPDGGGTYLLPQLVGVEKAFELIYSGEIISAEEALRIGMVGRVVPHDDLMKATMEVAETIAGQPQIAIELAKQGVYSGLDSDMKTGFLFESFGQRVCQGTEDHIEGVKSFLEKRKPEFKGC